MTDCRPDNVIQLTENGGAATLRKLADLIDEGKITAAVIMAHEAFEEGDPRCEIGRGSIHRYWYGSDMSCLTVLGMVEYSKELILRYMLDDVDLCRRNEGV